MESSMSRSENLPSSHAQWLITYTFRLDLEAFHLHNATLILSMGRGVPISFRPLGALALTGSETFTEHRSP